MANDINEQLEEVAAAAENVAATVSETGPVKETEGSQTKRAGHNLDFILDVTLQVTVEVGRARMTIQDLLQLGQGSVVELEKLAGEPLDVYINGKQVARGEAVIVNEKFGVRLTDIISPDERIDTIV